MPLQFETVAGTLQTTLRPRIHFFMLASSLVILCILLFAGLIPAAENLVLAIQFHTDFLGRLVSVSFLTIIGLFNLYAVMHILFYTERISVNQTHLEICRCLSLTLSRRSFPISSIHNLRYEEWSMRRSGVRNAIRFETAGKTITFAYHVPTLDCHELVHRIQMLHPTTALNEKPDPLEITAIAS
jgi:high-affinity nickel permease